MLVGEHGLDQLVRLVYDPVVPHLCERDLLGFDESLHDDDGVLVEAGMVDLVEVCDELQHLLAAVALVWSSRERGLAARAVSFWGTSINCEGAQDLHEVDVPIEYRAEQPHPVERLRVAATEQLASERKQSLR